MYENNSCSCGEKMNAMELREPMEKQVCNNANELLALLCEIESMAARIDGTLFGRLDGEKKCTPTPSCLAENIDIAADEARIIAKILDKIIQRL